MGVTLQKSKNHFLFVKQARTVVCESLIFLILQTFLI